jgi:hypothetical protein
MTPTGEDFKQQAWSQASQHLRQGEFVNAARDVGSLFTSKNPAAVSAVDQTSSALHSILPQGAPRPQPPVATVEEFRKLPKEQQDAYAQELAKWRADQYAQSMQLAAGFMAPGPTRTAASEAASQVKGAVTGSALKEAGGQLFRTVDQAAANANLVIDANKPGQAALEILQNKQAGGQMTQGIRQFLERATAPGQQPITYQEARQFYSNLNNISMNEMGRLTPNSRRLPSNFVSALDDSLREATATIGQQDNYAQAMERYAKGAQRSELFSALKKKYAPALIKGAFGAAGAAGVGYPAYSLWELLHQK